MPMCVSMSLATELLIGQLYSSQTPWLKLVMTMENYPQTIAPTRLAAIVQLETPQLSHTCLYTTAYWLMRQLFTYTGGSTK